MPSRVLVVPNSKDLEQTTTSYTTQGFMVVNKTDEVAVLRKQKQFNMLLGVIGFLFCGVGLLVYAIVYSMQSDSVIEIRVRAEGQSELRLSDDRRWWWDGEQWQDAARSVPPGARRSDDGQHWWDGSSWRPVPTSEQIWKAKSLEVPAAIDGWAGAAEPARDPWREGRAGT